MRPSRSTCSVVAAGLLASGCVIVPVTVDSYDPDCQVVAHHMALQAVQLGRFQACSDQGCTAMLLAAMGVTAVSAVVSGSIAVVGNVVYWADHRASCLAPEAAPAPAPAASA